MKTGEEKLKEVKEILHYWGEDDKKTLESIVVLPNGKILIDSVSFSGSFIADLDKHGYTCNLYKSSNRGLGVLLYID